MQKLLSDFPGEVTNLLRFKFFPTYSLAGKAPVASCANGNTHFLVKNDGVFFSVEEFFLAEPEFQLSELGFCGCHLMLRAIEYKSFQVQKDKYCWSKLLKRHPRNKKATYNCMIVIFFYNRVG